MPSPDWGCALTWMPAGGRWCFLCFFLALTWKSVKMSFLPPRSKQGSRKFSGTKHKIWGKTFLNSKPNGKLLSFNSLFVCCVCQSLILFSNCAMMLHSTLYNTTHEVTSPGHHTPDVLLGFVCSSVLSEACRSDLWPCRPTACSRCPGKGSWQMSRKWAWS